MKSKTFTDIMNESIDVLERMIAYENESIKRYKTLEMPFSENISRITISKHQATIDAYKFSIEVYKTTELYKGE